MPCGPLGERGTWLDLSSVRVGRRGCPYSWPGGPCSASTEKFLFPLSSLSTLPGFVVVLPGPEAIESGAESAAVEAAKTGGRWGKQQVAHTR